MPSMQDIIDAEFAAQQARDYLRLQAHAAGAIKLVDRREAASELRAAGVLPMTGVVEAGKAAVAPIGVSAPSPNAKKPEAYCKFCGKLFKAKTLAGAKLSKSRHEKKDHADESASR